jgi:hypothetical protein
MIVLGLFMSSDDLALALVTHGVGSVAGHMQVIGHVEENCG